jgi:HAD superfamily hydrolase (TIGR01509 family)
MTLQAVFFDMGGTIETFSYTPTLRLAATPGLRRILSAAGIDLGLGDEQLHALVSTGLDRYHDWSLRSLEELPPLRVWQEYVFQRRPVDPERLARIAEDLMLYIETRYYQRAMRPEMPAVLEAIRGMGLKLGVISNVCSRGQVPFGLESYGLRHFFDPVILSSEYGRRKPDPAIFHYAARLARVPASACAFVGDRLGRDVEGARRAGYRLAVQIRHEFRQEDDRCRVLPDAVIDDMRELVPILKAVRAAETRGEERPVRALLFDAGDILYHRPNKKAHLRRFLEGRGIRPDGVPRQTIKALESRAYSGEISRSELRSQVLALYGIRDAPSIAEAQPAFDADDNIVELIDGVAGTLQALKAHGFLLGMVTNTAIPIHIKLDWFERGGFGDVWDSVVSSLELRVRKPDPRIYLEALNQLGLPADRAAFVGHSISELDGARAVGLRTIAFHYEPGTVADHYLESFSDLLDLALDALQARATAAA